MREILISVFEWLVCLSEEILVFLLFRNKLGCDKPKLYWAIGLVPILASVTYAANRLELPWIALAFICIALHLIYAGLLFNGSIAMKCLWSPVPFILFCISNYTVLIIFYLIIGNGDSSLIPGDVSRIIAQLIYIAINFGMLIPLSKIKQHDGDLPAILRVGTVLFSLLGAAVAMYCFSGLITAEDGNRSLSSWIQCSAVIVLSIALLLLSGYLSRLYHKHLETQKELQKSKLEAEHISQVSAMYEYVRGLRHDLKGMISTVSSMAERGEYENVKKYLNELNDAADETKLLINTGNPAIDATISAKLMLADKNGITVDQTFSIPENLGIESLDLCSIIMNLADNAIEAVSPLPLEKRRICFSIIDKGGMLAIDVKNACNGNYRYEDGKIMTTKTDKNVHGIGIERVSGIVRKHHGYIKIEPMEHSFEVSILLPLEKAEK